MSQEDEVPYEDDGDDGEEEERVVRDIPEGCIKMRPSSFQGIPATVYFDYPSELGVKREDGCVVEALKHRKLAYNCYWERICIKNAFKRAWFVKSEKQWTALWSKHQNPTQMQELNCLQKVNHFPGSW